MNMCIGCELIFWCLHIECIYCYCFVLRLLFTLISNQSDFVREKIREKQLQITWLKRVNTTSNYFFGFFFVDFIIIISIIAIGQLLLTKFFVFFGIWLTELTWKLMEHVPMDDTYKGHTIRTSFGGFLR